jgi:hypothetical protein
LFNLQEKEKDKKAAQSGGGTGGRA